MHSDQTSDEDPRLTSETPEPVPEADALEQADEIAPETEEDDPPSVDADVPEADALEQSRVVPQRDDEHR
jgi:hypothetical protein